MGRANGGESSGVSDGRRPTTTLLLADDETTVDPYLDVDSETTNVLVVSAERSMRSVVEAWRRRGGVPATLGIVSYTEFDRSAAASGDPSRQSLSGGDITLTSMSDPADLRRLGTAITLYLDDWADTDHRALVYVDALDPFVDAGGVEAAFQFLHLLGQSVDRSAADAVIRLDPSTVDERTVKTVKPLFDHVCDCTADTADEADDELDADFGALLSNRRRRFVLRTLLDTSGLGLEELATRLAHRENDTDDPSEVEVTRSYTALASIHVPRLADANLVVFDREANTVRLADGDWSDDRLERLLGERSDD